MRAIDETIHKRFETVLPDGTVFPAFIDARGRQVVMPGRIEPETFVAEAEALIARSLDAGLLDPQCRVAYLRPQARAVLHRFVRPLIDDDGGLLLDWNVDENQADTIPVTLYEA